MKGIMYLTIGRPIRIQKAFDASNIRSEYVPAVSVPNYLLNAVFIADIHRSMALRVRSPG